ncbi:hypothetical protein BFP97_14460 [Roseivirga sp. 4D4]|uniref:hypothetical protein n=1 Tax=Roseivirga sp. 4D4 TaxID=1889784 RepID=UPI000852FAEA|nr:hypothetical protein [Roseivirga sp. 4D4]OEK02650.1 hypothetical protein BFP97_14460 [Roseivirga sp. 4D4]
MFKRLLILFLLCACHISSAQKPTGLWILKYVKALQPVFTMVEIDGQYEMVDEDPQDSTFLYNSGLMTLEFQKRSTAKTHSWDGEEQWTFDKANDQIYFYGQRDTLYGTYNKQELILRSTLDDRPTYYHFTPFEAKKISTPKILEGQWQLNSSKPYFKDLQVQFTTDSTYQVTTGKSLKSQKYFTYLFDDISAVEFDFPPNDKERDQHEMGTIYIYQTRKKEIKGVFYAIKDGVAVPIKSELTLTRVDN